MKRYNHTFRFPLYTPYEIKPYLLGYVDVTSIVEVNEKGIYSVELSEVNPVEPFTVLGAINWQYESQKSIHEMVIPVIEAMEDEFMERYQMDEENEQREHESMQETYKSLNRQFIHP